MAEARTSRERRSTKHLDEPVHMRWKEYRRSINWDIPGADVWGFHRGIYPDIESRNLTGHVVHIPAGQASQPHARRGPFSRIIVMLRGEVEFTLAGKVYELGPMDLLMIPEDTPYSYMNVGTEVALMFHVAAKSHS